MFLCFLFCCTSANVAADFLGISSSSLSFVTVRGWRFKQKRKIIISFSKKWMKKKLFDILIHYFTTEIRVIPK